MSPLYYVITNRGKWFNENKHVKLLTYLDYCLVAWKWDFTVNFLLNITRALPLLTPTFNKTMQSAFLGVFCALLFKSELLQFFFSVVQNVARPKEKVTEFFLELAAGNPDCECLIVSFWSYITCIMQYKEDIIMITQQPQLATTFNFSTTLAEH